MASSGLTSALARSIGLAKMKGGVAIYGVTSIRRRNGARIGMYEGGAHHVAPFLCVQLSCRCCWQP